jgi:hypothetical protein
MISFGTSLARFLCMMNSKDSKLAANFVRRVNRDGSVDSICTRCYVTVANGNDSDLERAEATHQCRGKLSN